MDLITIDDLRRLSSVPEQPCVSVYMPTNPVNPANRYDTALFRKLLSEAKKKLTALGLRHTEAEDILRPAFQFVEDEGFWRQQKGGLVFFLSEGQYCYFRLPLPFEELAVVSRRFHLKPMLPFFSNNGLFFILALSQKRVCFYQATRYDLTEMVIKDMPRSLAEALRFHDREKQLQHHSDPSAKGLAHHRGKTAIYHGQGTGKDDHKTEIALFCKRVDDYLLDYLRKHEAPLVLAADEYVRDIYRQVSGYRHIVPGGIAGNPEPERVSVKDLHKKAWDIVRPVFAREQKDIVEQYGRFKAHGRTAEDVRVILPPAAEGRVDTLFVEKGSQQWGTYDQRTHNLEIHRNPITGDEDLLDLTAVQTLSNDGRIWVVDREEMPVHSRLAAIFRY